MATAIITVIAVFSTAALIALWFWVVRGELRERQKAVESARRQLAASRQQCIRARSGPDEASAQDILARSQSVCHQAEQLYDQALRKPQSAIPAWVLGFRKANAEHTSGK